MDFTVADFLALSEIEGSRLVAGASGLTTVITRTNIVDNPDTFDWLMPGEFLFSTGYVFRESEELQRQIIRSLAEINCSGLCIKIKRYFDQIPRCMVEEAERLGFPLIELPFSYSLSTVISYINQRLYQQNDSVLEKTISIHRDITRAALESGNLQGIVDTLAHLVGNSVILTDSNWNLLSYSNRAGNPLPLSEYINTMRKDRPFPKQFTDSLPQDLRHFKKAVTRTFSPDDEHSVLCRVLPVAVHNTIYGYLVVWESERSLTDLDFIALDQTAIVVAMERIRAKEVEQTKLRVRKDFFDDLLSGNIESVNAIRFMAEHHGLNFDRGYRCLLVNFGEDRQKLQNQDQAQYRQDQERCYTAIAQAADAVGLRVTSVPRGLQTAVLVELSPAPASNEPRLRAMAQSIVDRLSAPPALDQVLVVVGAFVENLSEIHKSFRTAQHGIHLSRSIAMESRSLFMDDFAVYQLLSESVDRESLRRFCQASIGALAAHDKENHTQFLETLDRYFQYQGNISDAAKSMYIHRNTYIYRLEKIKALLNLDFNNPQKMLELQLSLLIYRLLMD